MPKKGKKIFYLDYGILVPYLILAIIGIIMSYSAGSYWLLEQGKPEGDFAIKEAIFLVISLVIIAFMYRMKTEVFQNRRFVMMVVIVIAMMLIGVLFTTPISGARAWINLFGIITIQPAEFMKIIVVWYLAFILSRRENALQSGFFSVMGGPLMIIAGLIGLVFIEPDAGGAAMLVLLVITMLLISGVSYWYTIVVIGGGVVLSTLAINVITLIPKSFYPDSFQHIYARFASFKNPFVDPLGDGNQMINSYFAIHNGGWRGLGLGQSIQKKGFLKEAHSDFMFSIVLEELGLIIGIIILFILLFLILRIIWVGVRATTSFNSLMCLGIGSLLLLQVFINLGGVLGIIPLTGVTFPFISQGGSSLITLSVGIGFALNIRADELRRRHLNQARLEAEIIHLPVK